MSILLKGVLPCILNIDGGLMKTINYADMRVLFRKNVLVMQFFRDAYKDVLGIEKDSLFNHNLIKGDTFLVNDDFESKPMYFCAFYNDNSIYLVARIIFVDEAERRKGYGAQIIDWLKSNLSKNNERAIQIGVECRKNANFTMLDNYYSYHDFKRSTNSKNHGLDGDYHNYFWSDRAFCVNEFGPVGIYFK